LTTPLKLFDDKQSVVRFARLKIDSGIWPCSLLLDSFRWYKEYDEMTLIIPVN
jgi:hypothetical protein